MSLLEVNHLKKIYTARYGGNSVQALADVNFTIENGEYTAIMGESGSGKTTLLNIIATLDRPTSGTVRLEGQELSTIPEGGWRSSAGKTWALYSRTSTSWTPSPSGTISCFRWCWTGWICGRWTAV